jgi:leucine dehydrogenase
MPLFDTLHTQGHEQLVHFHNRDLNLRCIVAIHSTVLGPALGGVRMWPYAAEDEALKDALGSSRAMTYKAAIAGLNHGGGKAVIIGNPETDKSEAMLRAFGRCIGSLSNRFIAMEDVGTTVDDMDLLQMETDSVIGAHGGSGDPSPFTALGALHGIRACLNRKYGHTDIARASFAVQGAGGVGYHLAKLLRAAGAKVFVTDINEQRIEALVDECGAEALPMQQIYEVDATVFAPCAMGGILNEDTVPRLQCAIVAGGANNQLESNQCGTLLEQRGILYAPDYAINAGGLMNSALELHGYDPLEAQRRVAGIESILTRIFELAVSENIPSWQAADALAERRIAAIGRIRLSHY